MAVGARGVLAEPGPGSAQTVATADPFTNWIERLAQWAERQPQHRRFGSHLLDVVRLPQK